MMKAITLIGFGMLLLACGSEPDLANNAQKIPGIIPEHQLEALENAKNVEQMLFDADAQRREKLKEIEN
jgi:hypothetical protein